MKFFIFASLSFLLVCCSRKTCIDTVAVNRNSYERYLIILEESKHPNKLVMPKEVDEAITFLEIVSGITSRAERNDNRAYRNKSDFKSDIKLWKQWYKKYQCELTLHYVDSVFKSVGVKR